MAFRDLKGRPVDFESGGAGVRSGVQIEPKNVKPVESVEAGHITEKAREIAARKSAAAGEAMPDQFEPATRLTAAPRVDAAPLPSVPADLPEDLAALVVELREHSLRGLALAIAIEERMKTDTAKMERLERIEAALRG